MTASTTALPHITGLRVDRRLGKGGMAEVYLATQLSLGRKIALKVLSAEDSMSAGDAERFEREAQTIARLDHPHIVGIYDVGRMADGRLYFTMPYLPGGDLAGRDLRNKTAEVADVMRGLVQALGYAHHRGVVHRDVKPANVLFDGNGRALLADFGIAIANDHDHRMTSPGKALGSTGYMSPEQARGAELDGRSDLYSLGVMCYEMLIGDLPYHGADAFAIAFAHMYEPIPRLPAALMHWQPFIDRAMAKEPADRFSEAETMLAALDDVLLRQKASADAARTQPITQQQVQAADPPSAPVPSTPPDVAVTGPSAASSRTLPLVGALLGVVLLAILASIYRVVTAPSSTPDGSAVTLPQEASTTRPTAPNAATAPMPAPPPDDAVIERELKLAQDALKKGNLFAPADENAADLLLDVLARVPNHLQAQADASELVKLATRKVETAISAGRTADAETIAAGVERVIASKAVDGDPVVVEWKTRYVESLRVAVDKAAAALDRTRINGWKDALDRAVGYDVAVSAWRERYANLPKPGARFSDKGGPEMALIPGNGEQAPFALMRFELTRAEYADFARATGRAPGKCRDRTGPFAALRRRDWQDPGFEQGEREPVVCVSYADAEAYAAWLGGKTHERYRLPTLREWLTAAAKPDTAPCKGGNQLDQDATAWKLAVRYDCHDGFRNTAPVGKFGANAYGVADLVGNVREWTSDCAGEDCITAGSSFVDGKKTEPLQTGERLAKDSGAPYVGVRLVREVRVDALPGK